MSKKGRRRRRCRRTDNNNLLSLIAKTFAFSLSQHSTIPESSEKENAQKDRS